MSPDYGGSQRLAASYQLQCEENEESLCREAWPISAKNRLAKMALAKKCINESEIEAKK